jgi:ribosomal protein L11 methylase PrmA
VNTYEAAEAEEKAKFVSEFVEKTRPGILFDVGCNTGHYSEAALRAGAQRVIGFDFDQSALDRAFQRATEKDLQFTPLYLDGANPSPSQGWRQRERLGLRERLKGDAVIALAFEHHLAIGRNVPLGQVVEWICDFAPAGIVEFVSKADPTVGQMLRLREDIFPDYTQEAFEAHLSRHARIVAQREITSAGRTLYWFAKG